MRKKSILVIGGAGFIGSHVNHMLYERGYHTVVLDNLSQGFKETILNGVFIQGCMGDPAILDHIFTQYEILAVMHFAAFIDVGESVLNPTKYYRNNVFNTLSLLESMKQHCVKNIIFSSTAAVYGLPLADHLLESHPCDPINPYGNSKLMCEKMLKDFQKEWGLQFVAFRYFNAAGGDPKKRIKNYRKKENNLIPRILKSVLDDNFSLSIYGTDYPTSDGTCIRDYIHIEDLGNAHITAMENLLQNKPISHCYNLGNGKGFSVKEVIDCASEVVGKKINVTIAARRPGDPPILIADATKAKKELGWQPQKHQLREMIQDAWNAMK